MMKKHRDSFSRFKTEAMPQQQDLEQLPEQNEEVDDILIEEQDPL